MKKNIEIAIRGRHKSPLDELRVSQFLYARKRNWILLLVCILLFPALLIVSWLDSGGLYYSLLLAETVLLSLTAYILKEITRRAIYVTIFLSLLALTLIHIFSLAYSLFGLCAGDCLSITPTVIYEKYAASYFSIVSWTTLGYGDYQPVGWVRIIASIEALIGYIFMGIIVGFSAQVTFEMFKGGHESKTAMNALSEEVGYSSDPEPP